MVYRIKFPGKLFEETNENTTSDERFMRIKASHDNASDNCYPQERFVGEVKRTLSSGLSQDTATQGGTKIPYHKSPRVEQLVAVASRRRKGYTYYTSH